METYFFSSQLFLVHNVNSKRFGTTAESLKSWADLEVNGRGGSTILFDDVLLLSDLAAQELRKTASGVALFVSSSHVSAQGLDSFVRTKIPSARHTEGAIIGCAIPEAFTDLLALAGEEDPPVTELDVTREVRAIRNEAEVKTAALTTKGQTLKFFDGLIDASVDPGTLVSYEAWTRTPDKEVRRITELGLGQVIARSSALSEDTFAGSNAGAYCSVPNVDGAKADSVASAIDAVFGSYGTAGPGDHVLIQRQISDVTLSGVCSSRSIGRNGPYYVINYDDTSGRTDTITSGSTNDVHTLFIHRGQGHRAHVPPPLDDLIEVVQQIEGYTGCSSLDIEFIVDSRGSVHIVQIRPLVGDYDEKGDHEVNTRIEEILSLYERYRPGCETAAEHLGAVFGVMPDANPAELIGLKPKPLAFSLYRRLITDDVVTEQRFEYGYTDVRPVPHMIQFGGTPYVNVRSSFRSFTPRAIRSDLRDRLVELYVERLMIHPALHDKVEFEIVVSTWFPGIGAWISSRYGEDLSRDDIVEIVDSAKSILLSAITRVPNDLRAVEEYAGGLDALCHTLDQSPVSAVKLLDICHQFGCKPFAHLARSAFVAVSVLKGLLAEEIISDEEYHGYLQSVESVSSKLKEDAFEVQQGRLSWDKFVEKYGHLRPGTYDITSEAYFERPTQYLGPLVDAASRPETSSFDVSEATKRRIQTCFERNGIDLTFEQFDHFARHAIHGREFGKFAYTKFLSHALDRVVKWGAQAGICREDLAFLTYTDLKEISVGGLSDDPKTVRAIIAERRKEYALNSRIELPDLVGKDTDFVMFHKTANRPNFITRKMVNASVQVVEDAATSGELAGSIALVEGADPGYDWLFGRSIAGLVTKYGGANSHMAIRCAELGVPAAIGVGELTFEWLTNVESLRMDCSAGLIEC